MCSGGWCLPPGQRERLAMAVGLQTPTRQLCATRVWGSRPVVLPQRWGNEAALQEPRGAASPGAWPSAET